MSTPQPDIWVVVVAYGAPLGYTKEDGSRYGPIVFETIVDGATREAAQQRAEQSEREGYGAARIARLVFDDQSQETPK